MNINPKYRDIVQTSQCMIDYFNGNLNDMNEEYQNEIISPDLVFLKPRNTEYILDKSYSVQVTFWMVLLMDLI